MLARLNLGMAGPRGSANMARPIKRAGVMQARLTAQLGPAQPAGTARMGGVIRVEPSWRAFMSGF